MPCSNFMDFGYQAKSVRLKGIYDPQVAFDIRTLSDFPQALEN